MTTTQETVRTRGAVAVRDPAPLMWAVAGACWAGMVALVVLGGSGLASHDAVLEHGTLPWAVRLPAFVLVWTVMVGAMMLPTTVPMVRLVVAVSARAPSPGRVRAALLLAYLAVWAGFGLAALAGDRAVHFAVEGWPWLDAHPGVILAGTLGLAGGFQFSTLKDRCLTACRNPLSMLWQHYGRGARAAWTLGVRHALSCLGCCWALMLLMFGVGAGSLAWMAVLTAVMVAEKTTRWGHRLVTPVGVVLLVSAGVLLVTSSTA